MSTGYSSDACLRPHVRPQMRSYHELYDGILYWYALHAIGACLAKICLDKTLRWRIQPCACMPVLWLTCDQCTANQQIPRHLADYSGVSLASSAELTYVSRNRFKHGLIKFLQECKVLFDVLIMDVGGKFCKWSAWICLAPFKLPLRTTRGRCIKLPMYESQLWCPIKKLFISCLH
jgi:hypothetical protein